MTPPRSIRALLWDNDGVLVDTEGLYFQATRETLAQAGVELTEAQYVELFLVGNRGMDHFAPVLGGAEVVARLRNVRGARYANLLSTRDLRMPDAEAVVAALAARFRMALVTSSAPDHLAIAHARTGLLPRFEHVVALGDYVRSKPHPDPYLEALRRLNLRADECLAIEDSRRGLLAAKAAGLTCWVVPTPLSAQAPLDEADRVVARLADLPALLGGSD